jgi:hypothetical protein
MRASRIQLQGLTAVLRLRTLNFGYEGRDKRAREGNDDDPQKA